MASYTHAVVVEEEEPPRSKTGIFLQLRSKRSQLQNLVWSRSRAGRLAEFSKYVFLLDIAVSPGVVRRDVADDDTGSMGCCFYILAFFSFLLIICLFPLSLIWSVKV